METKDDRGVSPAAVALPPEVDLTARLGAFGLACEPGASPYIRGVASRTLQASVAEALTLGAAAEVRELPEAAAALRPVKRPDDHHMLDREPEAAMLAAPTVRQGPPAVAQLPPGRQLFASAPEYPETPQPVVLRSSMAVLARMIMIDSPVLSSRTHGSWRVPSPTCLSQAWTS